MQKNNPFHILNPNERWAPTQGQLDAFQNAYEKLLPPLLHKIRLAVSEWREKGYVGVNFKMEYQAEDGNIRDFFPDFFVKRDDKEIFIVETKGREDLDDIRKIKRLCLWCNDVNKNQDAYRYRPYT